MLERFSAARCDAVWQHTDSRALLDGLEQVNLFVQPLDGQRTEAVFSPTS
jgi:ATP/maltotriose-dependent transcriptional regulator MalT